MRFTQQILIVAVGTMAMVASAGTAGAQVHSAKTVAMADPAASSYSGNWPITITRSQRSNGTGCLTLNGNSNSGQASLVFGSQKYPYGSFVVRNGILIVNIVQPLYGQNGALMFIAHAHRGQIGEGAFEDIEGGSNFDFGTLAFGTKGGC
jgi:hypothetical protein